MKIGIDCGHTLTGADTGAVGIRAESELTREVGEKVISKLQALGHTVIRCYKDTCSNLGDSLSYRVNKANSNNVDLFVSIHFNAFNGKAYGTEVYTYKGKNLKQARDTLNSICSLGYANRGIKDGSNLYVIRNSKMPAMLVECCFVDSVSDMKKFNAENMASAIVKGLTGSNAITGSKAIPSKPTPPTWEYYISGDIIKRLQTELNKQFGAGLKVDGYCGTKTLNKLVIVRINARGEITRIVQELLRLKGYSVGKYGADGVFGNSTYNAVVNFQHANGLTVDGVVGINTWKALLKK